MGEAAEALKYNLYIAAYVIVLPIYFIVGLIGHGICIFAFSKQYRKEKAYGYQILVSLSDFLEILAVPLCMVVACNVAGIQLPLGFLYQKSYFVMWFAAHIAVPMEHTFMTTSLLMYVGMAADRAFAIGWPLKHLTVNHRRHQLVAAIVCFALGASTSIFDAFRHEVRQEGDAYIVYIDNDFLATTTAFILDILRNSLRFAGNVALIACNVVLVISYNSNARKLSSMMEIDEASAAKRKATQNTLVVLTLTQSFFQTVDMTFYNIYFTMEYGIPGFSNCYGLIMAPLCHLMQEVAGNMDLLALVAVSKQFRRTIKRSFRCARMSLKS